MTLWGHQPRRTPCAKARAWSSFWRWFQVSSLTGPLFTVSTLMTNGSALPVAMPICSRGSSWTYPSTSSKQFTQSGIGKGSSLSPLSNLIHSLTTIETKFCNVLNPSVTCTT